MVNEWTGFKGGHYETEIDVRDFIKQNYTPYYGDESFLEGPTDATNFLWNKSQNYFFRKIPKNKLAS